MSQSRMLCTCLGAVALAATLLPVPAHAASPVPDAPLFYLFQAEPLGHPSEAVTARFEVRSRGRVLGADEVLLSFGRKDSLLVPIKSSPWTVAEQTTPDVELLVFADGLLLDRFDGTSLRSYNRVLRNLHAGRFEAVSGKPRITTKIFCESPCGGGCGPSDDYDCDGVINSVDNCTDDPNPGQQNCDGDAWGDVCDATDGIFQPTGPVETCMTDKDDHGYFYITFEHHVEQRLVDVSACGSPDRWNRWIREDNDCVNISDKDCCMGLRFSISAIGDDPLYWCHSSIRNIDFCH